MKAKENCDSAWNIKNVTGKQIKGNPSGVISVFHHYERCLSSKCILVLLIKGTVCPVQCCESCFLTLLYRPLCAEFNSVPPYRLNGFSERVCRVRGITTDPSMACLQTSTVSLPTSPSPRERPADVPDKLLCYL